LFHYLFIGFVDGRGYNGVQGENKEGLVRLFWRLLSQIGKEVVKES